MDIPRRLYRRQPGATVGVSDGFMAVASAEIPPEDERGGDIIRIAGMEVPGDVPLLASHRHSGEDGTPTVIGKCNRFDRRRLEWRGQEVPALYAGWDWADTELAMKYRSLWERGFLDSVSVGIAVREAVPLNTKDPWGGWDVRRSELLELSVVAVPANPAARAMMKGMGLLHPVDELTAQMDTLVESAGLIKQINQRLDDIESAVSVIAEAAKQRHVPKASPDYAVIERLRALRDRLP